MAGSVTSQQKSFVQTHFIGLLLGSIVTAAAFLGVSMLLGINYGSPDVIIKEVSD